MTIQAGIEIGSRQTAVAIGDYDPASGTVKALAGAWAHSRAVRNGAVISIPDAARDMRDLLKEVEAAAGAPAEKFILGMHGSHFAVLRSTGHAAINRTDNTIMDEDIETALSSARMIKIAQDRELYDEALLSYTVDHQRGIIEPMGLRASFLSVDTLLITARSTDVTNTCKAMELAGLGDVQCVYSPLALARVVLSPEERDTGCLLIDIGTEMSSAASFYDGQLWELVELPDGSERVTRGITDDHRNSKKLTGTFKRGAAGGVSPDAIISAGKDYFEAVRFALQERQSPLFHAPCEIVLCGPGARTPGIAAAAEQVFNIPVRMGFPQILSDNATLLTDHYLTTALSLLTLSQGQEHASRFDLSETKTLKATMKHILNMLRSL